MAKLYLGMVQMGGILLYKAWRGVGTPRAGFTPGRAARGVLPPRQFVKPIVYLNEPCLYLLTLISE